MPKYYKREITDLNGTGEKQYRYELRSMGAMDTGHVARAIHQRMHTFSEGDCMAMTHEMVYVIAEMLADGYTVTLDGLGNFSVSLGLADYDDGTPLARQGGEPNARRIHVRDVHFKPQRDFVRHVDRLCSGRLVREHTGTRPLRRSRYTPEERIQLALEFIRKNGFMRQSDYAAITGISRTTACRELRAICADPSSPIQSCGRISHKIYIEKVQERQGLA